MTSQSVGTERLKVFRNRVRLRQINVKNMEKQKESNLRYLLAKIRTT
jgi:hypothetical protein